MFIQPILLQSIYSWISQIFVITRQIRS